METPHLASRSKETDKKQVSARRCDDSNEFSKDDMVVVMHSPLPIPSQPAKTMHHGKHCIKCWLHMSHEIPTDINFLSKSQSGNRKAQELAILAKRRKGIASSGWKAIFNQEPVSVLQERAGPL